MCVVKQSDQPVEERRIEVRQWHSAEVGMCPAKHIWEYGSVIELCKSKVTRAVPGPGYGAVQHLQPKFGGKEERQRSHCKWRQQARRIVPPEARRSNRFRLWVAVGVFALGARFPFTLRNREGALLPVASYHQYLLMAVERC